MYVMEQPKESDCDTCETLWNVDIHLIYISWEMLDEHDNYSDNDCCDSDNNETVT